MEDDYAGVFPLVMGFVQAQILLVAVAFVDYDENCDVSDAIENSFEQIVDGSIVLAAILQDEKIEAAFREKETVRTVSAHLSSKIPYV